MNKVFNPALLENRPRSSFELKPKALDAWNSQIAASSTDGSTISILDEIGEDWWGDGITAKTISRQLNAIGSDKDVTVLINSPGGDMFEGLAIYNLLKEHQGKVTVKVLSLAASAASIIAMAGDEIQIAKAGFFMIHNCWNYVAGNRHDLVEFAEKLKPFDEAMASVYADKTGSKTDEMSALMDAETWLNGEAAINQGFADSLLPSDQITETESNKAQAAIKKLDTLLAKNGVSRSERRALFQEIKTGTHNAASSGTPSAAEQMAISANSIAELQNAMARFSAAANKCMELK